jgi:hypothetical protein
VQRRGFTGEAKNEGMESGQRWICGNRVIVECGKPALNRTQPPVLA